MFAFCINHWHWYEVVYDGGLLIFGLVTGILIGERRHHRHISDGFGHLTRISQHRALNGDDLVDAFVPRSIHVRAEAIHVQAGGSDEPDDPSPDGPG